MYCLYHWYYPSSVIETLGAYYHVTARMGSVSDQTCLVLLKKESAAALSHFMKHLPLSAILLTRTTPVLTTRGNYYCYAAIIYHHLFRFLIMWKHFLMSTASKFLAYQVNHYLVIFSTISKICDICPQRPTT